LEGAQGVDFDAGGVVDDFDDIGVLAGGDPGTDRALLATRHGVGGEVGFFAEDRLRQSPSKHRFADALRADEQ
jgi:hypothetical protein